MNKVFIPLSILVAGLIIAGAVVLTKNSDNTKPDVVQNENPEFELSPLTDDDHILGNPDAEILIVEYSDFECPYCGQFEPTMLQIMEEYGKDGKVAWVYRHFPIDQIHPDARPASEASECVFEQLGDDGFWNFSKALFSDQANNLAPEKMKEIAVGLGVDEAKYQECVDTGRYAEKVENDYQDGLLIAQADPQFGTPYSLIITKDGIQAPIRGAQSFSVIKQALDAILGSL